MWIKSVDNDSGSDCGCFSMFNFSGAVLSPLSVDLEATDNCRMRYSTLRKSSSRFNIWAHIHRALVINHGRETMSTLVSLILSEVSCHLRDHSKRLRLEHSETRPQRMAGFNIVLFGWDMMCVVVRVLVRLLVARIEPVTITAVRIFTALPYICFCSKC